MIQLNTADPFHFVHTNSTLNTVMSNILEEPLQNPLAKFYSKQIRITLLAFTIL